MRLRTTFVLVLMLGVAGCASEPPSKPPVTGACTLAAGFTGAQAPG